MFGSDSEALVPRATRAMGSEAAQLLEAADFAAHKHRQQRRKDPEGTPYINHPIGGRAGWEAVFAARGGWGLTGTGTQSAYKLLSTFFQSQAVYNHFSCVKPCKPHLG